MHRKKLSRAFWTLCGLAVCLLALSNSSAEEPSEEAVNKPLYHHWFKPHYEGDNSPLMHLLSPRIAPAVDFAVDFTDPTLTRR